MSINLKPYTLVYGRSLGVLDFGSSRKPLNKPRTKARGILKVFLIFRKQSFLTVRFAGKTNMANNKYNQVAEDLMTVVPMLKGLIAKNKEIQCTHTHRIEYALLHTLMKNPASMSELGDIFGISKPNMTAIVDKLIEEKKVKRTYDNKDRRIVRVEITASGQKAMLAMKEMMKKRIEQSISCISTEDIRLFHESVKNIKAILSRTIESEAKK